MRSIVVALVALFVVSAAHAGTTVYRWTTEDDVISFTDDLKRVPAVYKDVVEEIEPKALEGYARYTRIAPSTALDRLERSRRIATPVVTLEEEKCGTVRLRSERRDVGGFNKRFYIAEDDCGVLVDSPAFVDFYIQR